MESTTNLIFFDFVFVRILLENSLYIFIDNIYRKIHHRQILFIGDEASNTKLPNFQSNIPPKKYINRSAPVNRDKKLGGMPDARSLTIWSASPFPPPLLHHPDSSANSEPKQLRICANTCTALSTRCLFGTGTKRKPGTTRYSAQSSPYGQLPFPPTPEMMRNFCRCQHGYLGRNPDFLSLSFLDKGTAGWKGWDQLTPSPAICWIPSADTKKICDNNNRKCVTLIEILREIIFIYFQIRGQGGWKGKNRDQLTPSLPYVEFPRSTRETIRQQ